MCAYLLKKDDISALIGGLAILGTGGGGSPRMGRAILEKEFADGREMWIVDPDEVSDDSLVVSGGIMGSVKSLEDVSIDEQLAKWDRRFELMESAKLAEAYLGKKIGYVVPFEVGGENTPVIMALAARMGLKTVDGDGVGRSAPETHMVSFLAHGVSLTPMPLVDAAGNSIIVTGQTRPVFADEIGRWMVTRGGGMGANIHYPMSGKILKRVVIPRTISLSLEIGRNLFEARRQGENPVEVVAGTINGFPLFEGAICQIEGEDRGGFYIVNVALNGQGDYKGSQARMVIKNETMALWIDGSLKAVFPDLVCMLDPRSGEGIMSADLAEGQELFLLGVPCHPRLREGLSNPVAAEAFGGARYGHPEVDYTPLEELNKVR